MRAESAAAAARRALLLGLVWVVLTGGAAASIAPGIVLVGATAWLSLVLVPADGPRVRLIGLLRFVPFFLLSSLRAGVDVAFRALRPRMPLDPAVLSVSLVLEQPEGRIFLAAALSLLPGTLSARLEGARLTIHVLIRHQGVEDQVRALESRVGEIFRA